MNPSPLSDSWAVLLVSAFFLDLAIGDPHWLPHPVVLMGKAISWGEKILWSGKSRRDLFAGTALTLAIVGVSVAIAWAAVLSFSCLPSVFAFMVSALFASTTISTRGLLLAVARIEEPLRTGDIVQARARLSHIVGRETCNLDQDKILCAGLESLAESTCDGIVAPLFYLCLGGIPLAMAYKAVNTLDSMIGYRTERHFHFGKFAARLDDVFNFLPARMTALCMIAAAFVLKLQAPLAAKVVWRDHANHLSPNAGYPEAALAGAFGIRLGGSSTYFGKEIVKPYIGDDFTPAKIEMLKEARSLCLVTAILSLVILVLMSAAQS